jgi:hypothetical protein
MSSSDFNDFTPPPAEIVEKIQQLNGYSHVRANEYQIIAEQLDMLFKDVDAGLFGENAKTGTWYTHIKTIKDANPKPENPEVLEAELQQLIIAQQSSNSE